MKNTEVSDTTLAEADECGSSNRDQIRGLSFCHLVMSLVRYRSSYPNFLASSSSVGLSVSISS